jgi:hypothetical protein
MGKALLPHGAANAYQEWQRGNEHPGIFKYHAKASGPPIHALWPGDAGAWCSLWDIPQFARIPPVQIPFLHSVLAFHSLATLIVDNYGKIF